MIARRFVQSATLVTALAAVSACGTSTPGEPGAAGATTMGAPSTSDAATTVAPTTAPTTAPTSTVASQPGEPAPRIVKLDLVDTTRTTPFESDQPLDEERDLPTWVYLPEGASPAPLIVLAHGFVGHPDKFTELASYWSDAGYVVAVPAFPLSNDKVPQPSITDIAGQGGDVSFVIDEVLDRSARSTGPLANRVDPERIGLFGLSLGSLTVWNTVLGECCGDSRVDALIQSDGWFPFDHSLLATVPFPVMIAHSDIERVFRYDVIRDNYEALGDQAVLLTLHDAIHATVGENTATPADEAYQQATTVFWDRHLGGKPDEAFPPSVVIDGATTLEAGGATLPGSR